MPEDQTKRSALVLWLWGPIALVSIGAVVSFFWAAFHCDQFVVFSNAWGNVVSVAGVWIGLIAFLLTIFSLLITHQTEKEARRESSGRWTTRRVLVQREQELHLRGSSEVLGTTTLSNQVVQVAGWPSRAA
jgi:hypothetical protein